MGYRVYKYGCRPPTDGEERAVEQMRLRVQFWNALVTIEHAHGAAIESTLADFCPGSERSAMPRVDEDALSAWKQQNAALADRKRRGEIDPATYRQQRNELKQARPAVQKAEFDAWKVRRRAAFRDDRVRERLAELDADRNADVKAATAASDLWWCNYDDVLKSYTVARQRPDELRYHAWRNQRGKLSVRYQTGLSLNELTTDTRFQLEIVPPPDERAATAIRRRDYTRAIARVRIGSDGRAPVWLVLPLRLHRPLPPGALIRQIAVTREMLAGKPRWTLLIVVDEPTPERLPRVAPTYAVNIGWRVRDNGLRVAFWQSAAGHGEELILPQGWIDQMGKVDDLKSIRDLKFNLARDGLREWLRWKQSDAPAWLRDRTAYLGQWKAQGRLAALVIHWREARFGGDAEVYAALEAWRANDKHLWTYQDNLRDQLLASRLDRYRAFAARLAREAGAVRLHSVDLRTFADRKNGLGDDLPDAARHNRVLAAVSTLHTAIEMACAREGVPVTRVPKEVRITQTCHVCRAPVEFDAAAHLEYTCPGCGARWDQDQNAARNLLAWTPQTDAPSDEKGGLRTVAISDDTSAQPEHQRRAAP